MTEPGTCSPGTVTRDALRRRTLDLGDIALLGSPLLMYAWSPPRAGTITDRTAATADTVAQRRSMKRILTVTLNPALDFFLEVPHIVADRKMCCATPVYLPGGGGVNVSRDIERTNVRFRKQEAI